MKVAAVVLAIGVALFTVAVVSACQTSPPTSGTTRDGHSYDIRLTPPPRPKVGG